jgi:hypothetical protein
MKKRLVRKKMMLEFAKGIPYPVAKVLRILHFLACQNSVKFRTSLNNFRMNTLSSTSFLIFFSLETVPQTITPPTD